MPNEHWLSEVQDTGHDADEPPQTYGAHEGLPVVPATRTAQVPTEPVTLHASQAPPHAVLQQTPSTQLPERHWLFAVHAGPLPSFATQLVPLQ